MVDVADPGGLVRSQAIESPDGAFRVTLNGAETARPLAGRLVSESFGSAVQHVAFATSDIFETAKRLHENGFESLPMPQNYYDDLAARFDLAPDFVQRLQALNLLFDRDEAGTFLQLYSLPFGEGMFLEIAERSEGYAGYGAPNAPFRIAAQKRLMRSRQRPHSP